MIGINDIEASYFIKKIHDLNWVGYKVYLVGGIVEGWETRDIDVVIEGPIGDGLQLFYLMNRLKSMGPFDIFYSEDGPKIENKNIEHTITRGRGQDRRDYLANKLEGYWENNIFWVESTFPSLKHIEANRIYNKEPLLLIDGSL